MKAQHFSKHLKGGYLFQPGDMIKLPSRTYKLKIRFNGLKESSRFWNLISDRLKLMKNELRKTKAIYGIHLSPQLEDARSFQAFR